MKIYVVSHKNVNINIDNIRTIIKVGNNDSFNSKISDSSGNNISNKNPYFCELTAMYWIWKNDNSDIVGIEHYRRFFILKKFDLFHFNLLNSKKIEKILNQYDIIVSRKKKIKGQTVEENYKKSINHVPEDLDKLEEIIKNNYSEFYNSYNHVINNGNFYYPFNMLVCKKELFDEYCKWLFNILFDLEKEIKVNDRQGNQKRVFGYLSERLLYVWIYHNKLKPFENNVYFVSNNKLKDFLNRIRKQIF